MNCQMCKYRAQVLGFEAEVGAPQESHHHHVEGQGATAPGANVAECTLCGTFCTGACRLVGVRHRHDHAHEHHGHHAHDHGHEHHGHDHHHHDHDHDHVTTTTTGMITRTATRARCDGHHHPPYPHAAHPLGPESVRRHLTGRHSKGRG